MEKTTKIQTEKFWVVRVLDDEQDETYLAYPTEYGPYRNTYSCVSVTHPAVWKFTAVAEANNAIKKVQVLQTTFTFEVVRVEIKSEITIG